MGLLDLIKRNKEQREESQEENLPQVIVSASPELIESNALPKDMVPKAWSIPSKDAALSFLDKMEYYVAGIKSDVIAVLSEMFIPDPDHPRIRALIMRDIMQWVNEENLRLYSLLRLARSKYGFERRLHTLTAPRIALEGW